MATLEIRKKSLKTWLHVPSDASDFILSKFYCKTDASTFKIVEESGSNRREYSYTDITVYDDTDIGTPETFASAQALMLRLEALKYTGFNRDGDIPTSYIESVVAGANVTIDDTDPLNPIISSTGGGGTQDLQSVTNYGNSTTNSLNVQYGDEYTNVYTSNVYTANDTNNSYVFIENTGTIGVNSGDFEGTIKATNLTTNNVNLEFPQKTAGSYTIATTADIPTKTSDLINDGDNGVSHFISIEDLPSNLILYPTTTASDVSGYYEIVTSITDPDFDATAVDVSTGDITGSNQLIASLATNANIIVGNPGLFNVSTIGNIRRTSGSGTAEFYFEVYKRTSSGTETLITTSSNTSQVSSAVYTQFSATALWNDGVFLATDRIVLKFYGSKVGTGSNPNYFFQFGGSNPIRTTVPIPLAVVPSGGSPLTRQEFTFTSSQDFTLSNEPSYIYGVFVQGQELDSDQYSYIGTTLTILNTLNASDSVNVLYTHNISGFLDYYTKAETDAFLTNSNIKTILGQSSSTTDGYLSSTDWNTFNGKQNAITLTTDNFSGVATLIGNTLNIPNYDGFIPKLKGHETFRGVNYSNNSTTEVTSGGVTMATTASTIARSVASTNFATKQIRKGFYGSTVSAGRYTGTRGSALLWYLGGGFKYVCDVYISDTAYGSGCRQFYGMAGQTTDLGYSDSVLVSSLTNIFGVGSDSSDTNLQVFHNDGTGTATKVDLGVNFPANRTAGAELTTVYSVELYNEPSTSTVKYCVKNKETGAVAMGTLSANLPLDTQGLNFFASRCMGVGITNTGRFDLLILGTYSL